MIKKIAKYIVIFISLLFLLITLLTITSKIPKKYIEKNIEISSQVVSKNNEIKYIKRKHPFMWLHIYSDEVLLNIIYNIDTDNPLESSLNAKHYDNGVASLKRLMKDKTQESNAEYLRYWHGSMTIIRPLLVILNIKQIYVLNAILVAILFILLNVILIRRKHKIISFAFIIAFFMTGSLFVPFCLAYVWNYFIMFITTILAIFMEKKGDNNILMLMFINGILTCFFDFFTTELVTVLVPIVIVLAIRYKEERITDIKNTVRFVIWTMVIWFIGYSLMWFAKWIIASIVLNINAFDYVIDKIMIRINGDILWFDKKEIYKEVIPKNIFALYPLNSIKNRIYFYIITGISIILFMIFKKEKSKLKIIIPFSIISIVPYIRYLVLANHSYKHFFFTQRDQFAVIISIILILFLCIDKQKINKLLINFKNKIVEINNKTK